MISEVDVPKKCYQIGQKVAKMAKICQSGEKSSKWQKVTKMAKSSQIRLQGVSDGCRSQTAWARTTRGDLRAGTAHLRPMA